MDERLRRCKIHGPELRAYVQALVEAEVRAKAAEEGRTVVTDDDGETD